MDGVLSYFALGSGEASEVRYLSEEAVDRYIATDGLDTGD
jgi:hypothetical protein